MKHKINFRSIVIAKGVYKDSIIKVNKDSKKRVINKEHTLTKSMKK